MNSHKEHGGIVLEAALILPLFVTFIFVLIVMVQIAMAEIGLHSAVMSTTKQISAYFYPVDYVVQELKQSGTGQSLSNVLENMRAARDGLIQAEEITNQYSLLIPDSLLQVMEAEETLRLEAEQGAGNAYNVALNAVFLPMVWNHVDEWNGHYILQKNQLKIKRVTFPHFGEGGERYFSIEAEYRLKLPIPFFQIDWRLHKKGIERVWSGM